MEKRRQRRRKFEKRRQRRRKLEKMRQRRIKLEKKEAENEKEAKEVKAAAEGPLKGKLVRVVQENNVFLGRNVEVLGHAKGKLHGQVAWKAAQE